MSGGVKAKPRPYCVRTRGTDTRTLRLFLCRSRWRLRSTGVEPRSEFAFVTSLVRQPKIALDVAVETRQRYPRRDRIALAVHEDLAQPQRDVAVTADRRHDSMADPCQIAGQLGVALAADVEEHVEAG